MSELRGLQLRLNEIRASGVEVVAISVDTPAQNQEVRQRLGLDFPILADPERRAVRAFGLLHEGGAPDGSDIARPAIFAVEDGEILWRELTENWRVRIRPEALVAELEDLFAG